MKRTLLPWGVVLALGVALSGCHRAWGYDASAACPGVGADRIGMALKSDPALETKWYEPGKPPLGARADVGTYWATRRGLTACVTIFESPNEMDISVTSTHFPGASESLAMEQHLEYVCRLLSREIPQVGEWTRQGLDPRGRYWDDLMMAMMVAAITVAVWAIIRSQRRDRSRVPQSEPRPTIT